MPSLIDDLDPQDLAETGWGVIFAESTHPAVYDALAPLLRLREQQANRLFEGYREYHGDSGYQTGQSLEDFLSGRGIGASGLADPALMPYYLLLVGSPEEMGLDFQYEMSASRAVGRIHFDTLDDYARYAETVVAAEQHGHTCRAAIFGVTNGSEGNTMLLVDKLVGPLAEELRMKHPEWAIELFLGHEASKERLKSILLEPPSLLFTAGHGLCLQNYDSRQVAEQGAIVCSDWPGLGLIDSDSYYSAEDVDSGADLAGTIVFQFSCFSAATPAHSDFHKLIDDYWAPPDRPFFAGLPKRFMGLPGGRGALAVIGHVDRIWRYSILNEETNVVETLVFEQCLSRLLKGCRVGYAMEYLNLWRSNYAVRLSSLFLKMRRGETVDRVRLARTWLINNDARSYILLGDPAVRLKKEVSLDDWPKLSSGKFAVFRRTCR